MSALKKFGVAVAMTAVAAVPLGFSGLAGAQDAGDCGEGGTSVEETQVNAGGLLGAVAPVLTQTLVDANAPVTSPNAQSCNTNINKVGTGGGGGGHVAPATPSAPIGGATPRFAG